MPSDIHAEEEGRQNFVNLVAATETVYCLRGLRGFANCPSNENEAQDILLFFSDVASAERVRQAEYPDYQPFELTLFDFVFRWLAGMEADKVLAGVDYTPELVGLELDPVTLRKDLLLALGPDRSQQYLTRLRAALKEQDD